MVKSRLPVVAVIPAHNSAVSIQPLLDELIRQDYDDIYVIDDASDDGTVKIVRSYKSKVKLIENNENVGSGANRNRIIGRVDNAILHFIDADMQLLSKNTPDILRGLDWPDNTSFISGMVRNPDGSQNPFNYGPRPHIITSLLVGGLQFLIWQIGMIFRPLGVFLRKIFNFLLHNYPKIYATPRSRRVYWAAESNLAIKSNLFERHGGYDPRFKYSEIEDFALRLHRDGYHGQFDPRIDAVHASTDNLLKSGKKRLKARKQFIKKHGLLVHIIPILADYLEGRKTQKRYHR